MTLEEFKERLNSLKLNLTEFAELTDIPYSTISKYGRSNPVPLWVPKFLEMYEKVRELEEFKFLIKELNEKLNKDS
ncbi:MAG TPA: helix-turn-helix transcriptional regulator [Sulfurimonas sp.]|uniref:helix-turn-helix domain-containing protein n=1 Tax=Sulfurimonas sp. TaxID=2022749 RepID=UPI002D188675|nr:helix-turn-helix transcriptional regulator [Sulfurimonas sp.]HUH42348.1 helix-turn-helix transcriptional regulator [Sulfurimonas sp.]